VLGVRKVRRGVHKHLSLGPQISFTPHLDENSALFIPTLAGEAIVVGPDIPALTPAQIHEPLVPPDSKGPDYNAFWR
jgi:hypothetical protein